MKRLFPLIFAAFSFFYITAGAAQLSGSQNFEWTGPVSGNIHFKTDGGSDVITINEEAHTIIFSLGGVTYIGHYAELQVEPLGGGVTSYYAGLDDINEMEAGLSPDN